MKNKTRLLFLVILVEGYVVLACELLAIRQLIPFVGSGTENISIVISAVLLPLAIGYHFGGGAFKRYYAKYKKNRKRYMSVRKILLRNIISSLTILSLGLTYPFMEIFFALLNVLGIHHRLPQTAAYSLLFLVWPVFMLGQTVPLVSNYFSRKKLSEITGRMLFFSTTGSFFGSVFSTIVLMSYAGVHNTVIVTMFLLGLLAMLLVRRAYGYETWLCLFILGMLYMANNSHTMESMHVVADNTYNTVQIAHSKVENSKTFVINRSSSSEIDDTGRSTFAYVQYVEDNFIHPLEKGAAPANILVIGAGGFTVGAKDTFNHYTFVDIDKELKTVAEEHFLPNKLSPNKKFIAASAREFVRHSSEKYDLIFIDTYTNVISIPMETTSREFLLDVKKLLSERGVVVANIISNPSFRDKFSVRYNNTFASVFPLYSRQIIKTFDPWAPIGTYQEQFKSQENILYMYFRSPLEDDKTVYTDDKNTYSLDRL